MWACPGVIIWVVQSPCGHIYTKLWPRNWYNLPPPYRPASGGRHHLAPAADLSVEEWPTALRPHSQQWESSTNCWQLSQLTPARLQLDTVSRHQARRSSEAVRAEQVNLLQVLITGRANQGQWPDCQVYSNRSSDNTKDQLNYDDFGPHILPTGSFFSFPDITKCEILSWLLALVNVRRCDIPPTQHYQARHHDQLWLNSPSI